jgi:DNA-nicking Smr family endonuclease
MRGDESIGSIDSDEGRSPGDRSRMAKGRRSPPRDASKESFADAIESMGNVEPLDRTNLSDLPSPPEPHGGSRTSDLRVAAEHRLPTRVCEPGAIAGARATRAEMRRLRAGKTRPQQTIDLHGLNRDDAYARLCNAIARAADADNRCVLVVHGQGHHSADRRSVLRDALADWIESPPLAERVTGCCLAQPRDGGSGASYLLLRLRR